MHVYLYAFQGCSSGRIKELFLLVLLDFFDEEFSESFSGQFTFLFEFQDDGAIGRDFSSFVSDLAQEGMVNGVFDIYTLFRVEL